MYVYGALLHFSLLSDKISDTVFLCMQINSDLTLVIKIPESEFFNVRLDHTLYSIKYSISGVMRIQVFKFEI